MNAIRMHGWGDGGARGCNIVAGLTYRNVEHCISIFGNVFIFLSNIMIKNKTKITLLKFCSPSLQVFMLEFSSQSEILQKKIITERNNVQNNDLSLVA